MDVILVYIFCCFKSVSVTFRASFMGCIQPPGFAGSHLTGPALLTLLWFPRPPEPGLRGILFCCHPFQVLVLRSWLQRGSGKPLWFSSGGRTCCCYTLQASPLEYAYAEDGGKGLHRGPWAKLASLKTEKASQHRAHPTPLSPDYLCCCVGGHFSEAHRKVVACFWMLPYVFTLF